MVFPNVGLLTVLAKMPDFRKAQGQRHALSAILASVICGVLSGHYGVKQIVQWLLAQPAEFWHLLGYTRKPPKETWFRQVLAKLDPERWEAVVVEWLEVEVSQNSPSVPAAELEVVSVDGKTLCGTMRSHAKTLHLLAVWCMRADWCWVRSQWAIRTNRPLRWRCFAGCC